MDIANIIYCMVHRLKRKLKKVDVSAEHIIISVKEVGYCLRGYMNHRRQVSENGTCFLW